MKTKEELLQLLSDGNFDEFNEYRQDHSNTLIDLSESDLRGLELVNINFNNVDLTGSDLSDCDLTHANFSKCDLSSVNFSGSIIKNANFSFAILSGSKFINANLNGSEFTEADMSGADFTEANLSDADLVYSLNLSESIFNNYTIWPEPENLPDDFDSSYIDDLASLNDDDDDKFNDEYNY